MQKKLNPSCKTTFSKKFKNERVNFLKVVGDIHPLEHFDWLNKFSRRTT